MNNNRTILIKNTKKMDLKRGTLRANSYIFVLIKTSSIIKKITLAFCSFIFLLSSCKRDSAAESYYINGTWDVYEAYRSGEKTETLSKAFFTFGADSMQTNILGDTVYVPFSRDGRLIMQGGSYPIQFKIERFDKDTLELSAKIRKYSFLFKTLSRKKAQ
jgi:hypothetical protein